MPIKIINVRLAPILFKIKRPMIDIIATVDAASNWPIKNFDTCCSIL